MLDAEHFQVLLCVQLNMDSIPGLHTRYVVGQRNSRKTLIIKIFKSALNYPYHRIGFINFVLTCASKLSDESKVTPISFSISALLIVLDRYPLYIHHFLWRNVQFACCNIYQDEISIVMHLSIFSLR